MDSRFDGSMAAGTRVERQAAIRTDVELKPGEPRVDAVFLDQHVMRPDGDDLPGLDDHDPVRLADGRHAVRCDDSRPVP